LLRFVRDGRGYHEVFGHRVTDRYPIWIPLYRKTTSLGTKYHLEVIRCQFSMYSVHQPRKRGRWEHVNNADSRSDHPFCFSLSWSFRRSTMEQPHTGSRPTRTHSPRYRCKHATTSAASRWRDGISRISRLDQRTLARQGRHFASRRLSILRVVCVPPL